MTQITCVAVFADGTHCTRRRKYANGWCAPCDAWSRRNHGKDPSGRVPHRRVESTVCVVTFANGAACGRQARYAPGWCVNCWKWSREHGRSPMGRLYVRSSGKVLAELRRAAQATGDECLILDGLAYRWTATYKGEQINAARAVWIIANGRDPGSDFVLHTCHRGDKGCISVRHLYLGDATRNMRDMVEAGRATKANRGEASPAAKLTRDDVRTIRERFLKRAIYPDLRSSRAIAEEFGITAAYVAQLAAAERWTWLDADEADHGHVVTCTAHTVQVVATT
ncbi:hypothetical protein OG963_14245 [Streptomyces sp. NBC_01707]|uniref:hypothetical protein n=1 Tax=Streptomyces sp. NBC_01707 TaxID=2975914 RepID=UPI00352FE69A